MSTINSSKKIREQSLEAMRAKKLQDEVTHCTFRPQINTAAKKLAATGPVPIRGLEVFYGKQQQASRLAQAQKAREEKVFGYSYKARSYTTPKPFNLRSSSRTMETRREEEASECEL